MITNILLLYATLPNVATFCHHSAINQFKLGVSLHCDNMAEADCKNSTKLLQSGPLVTDIGDIFLHTHLEVNDEGPIEKKDFITELGNRNDGLLPYRSAVNKIESIDDIENEFIYEKVDEFSFSFNMDEYESALNRREMLLVQQNNDESLSNDAVTFNPLLLNKIAEITQNSLSTSGSVSNDNNTTIIKLELTSSEFNNLVKKNNLNKEFIRNPSINELQNISNDETNANIDIHTTLLQTNANHSNLSTAINNQFITNASANATEVADVSTVDVPTIVTKNPTLKLTLEKYPGELVNDLTGGFIIFICFSILFVGLDLVVDLSLFLLTYVTKFISNFILPSGYKHFVSATYMVIILFFTFITNIANSYDINLWGNIYIKLNNIFSSNRYPHKYKAIKKGNIHSLLWRIKQLFKLQYSFINTIVKNIYFKISNLSTSVTTTAVNERQPVVTNTLF